MVQDQRRGRGFGTRDERVGGRSEKAPDVDPPICPHCKTTGVYRPAKGNRAAFYGCPNYTKHESQKFYVDAARWVADQRAKRADTPPAADAPVKPATKVERTLDADEIFGGRREREPGQEG